MTTMTATYSPDDNRLRLYASSRLDIETYARVNAAGFKWAPRQKLFFAPMWTPARADLMLELCGSIDDEDTSLVERAEERAERFQEYSAKRTNDASHAHQAVERITAHIPLGQPILVGHHSERAARRDAERIENGMRKAVQCWEKASYWRARAAGALLHACHVESVPVRARRIKSIEGDKRKREKQVKESTAALALWRAPNLTAEQAIRIANFDHLEVQIEGKQFSQSVWSLLESGAYSVAQAIAVAERSHNARIAWATRWIEHYDMRLLYERGMLVEAGGTAADRFELAPGGQVLIGDSWYTVMRVNKSGDTVVSVTVNGRYVPVRGVEEIKDYRAPDAQTVAAVKAAKKLPPLCNYPGDGFEEMTQSEWTAKHRDYRITLVAKSTETTGAYRFRCVYGSGMKVRQVFLTDAKRVDPPAPKAPDAPKVPAPEREPAPLVQRPQVAREPAAIDDMRAQLKQGVAIAVAPQLFPTPAEVADRMVKQAGIEPGMTILEPSAGTGALLDAIRRKESAVTVRAIEIHAGLVARLRAAGHDVLQADFLACGDELGRFDAVLLNPPFEQAADIRHIEHARSMLKPGGVLVAICANGPRQQEKLRPMATRSGGSWTPLPAGTFQNAGTNVNTAILVMHAN